MSNGGPRVLVPNSVRKMILQIKEITGKHSEDEIYAMLRECNMDPNETTQRLLYLDTFHEVKRKRDPKKVNLNSRASEESKWTVGAQRRVAKGSQGNYSHSYASHGAGNLKSVLAQENGGSSMTEAGIKHSLSASEGTKNYANHHHHVSNSSTVSVNGPANVSGDTSNNKHDILSPAGVYSSPVVVPSLSTQVLGDAVSHEINSQSITEPNATKPDGNKIITAHDGAINIRAALADVSSSVKMIKESHTIDNEEHLEPSQASSLLNGHLDDISVQDDQLSQQLSDPCQVAGICESLPDLNISVVEATSKLDTKLAKLNISAHQPVIFPDNLLLPEDVKNGFIFGSLDASIEEHVGYSNRPDDSQGSIPAAESLKRNAEAVEECSMSSQDASSTCKGDCLDNSQSQTHDPDNFSHLKDGISSNAAHKYDQLKQEMTMLQGGSQHPFVHAGRNYGVPCTGNKLVQFEGLEPQSGSSQVSSTSISMPTVTHASGVGQPPMTLSPPPLPFFRQPYPPNYFPFGPYLPAFYMASNAQQFIGPNGFNQQPSAGNIYLSPAAVAAATPGIKFPSSQNKPGLNGGNLTQFGISLSYGPYNPSLAMNSGSPASNGDLTASESKEMNVYTTVQQFESPLVWFPPLGRDVPSLVANPYLPLGQNAAFPGIYHPAQTMAATPTPLQHSHAVAGSFETTGPTSGAYQ